MTTATTVPPRLTAYRRELDLSPDAFGVLRRSDDTAHDPDALRARMADDGYLFLPGCLQREQVIDARRVIVGRLAEAGLLEPGTESMEAIAAKGVGRYFMPQLAHDNAPLRAVGKTSVPPPGPPLARIGPSFSTPACKGWGWLTNGSTTRSWWEAAPRG